MSKITVEYLRDLMNEWNRDEISLSRFAELLNERAKKVVLGDDYFQKVAESIKQSPEPEQQPNISKQDQNLEIPSESEREKIAFRLKSHITTQLGKRGIDAFEDFSEIRNEVLLPIITDFILSRDKEKDAEIERLKGDMISQGLKHLHERQSDNSIAAIIKLAKEIESLKAEIKKERSNTNALMKKLAAYNGEKKALKVDIERIKGERKEWIDVKTKKPSLNRVGNEFLVAVKMASRYEYQIAEWFDMRDGETEPFFQIEYSWCGQQMTNKYVTHWAELIDFPSE